MSPLNLRESLFQATLATEAEAFRTKCHIIEFNHPQTQAKRDLTKVTTRTSDDYLRKPVDESHATCGGYIHKDIMSYAY